MTHKAEDCDSYLFVSLSPFLGFPMISSATLKGAAPVVAGPVVQSIRVINIGQNLFPGPGRPTTTRISIGTDWPADPVSIKIDGKSYPVQTVEVPGFAGGFFKTNNVILPILKDGPHNGSVRLPNGREIAVLFRVSSTH